MMINWNESPLCLCVYMYVCECLRMRLCMRVFMCLYLYICVFVCVSVFCACMYMFVGVFVYMGACVSECVCMRVCGGGVCICVYEGPFNSTSYKRNIPSHKPPGMCRMCIIQARHIPPT